MSIALFINPRSGFNRRDPHFSERYARIIGDAGRVVAAASLDELADEARAVAAQRPSIVAVLGGDGTLHKTVAALIRAHAQQTGPANGVRLPPIAILGGGTMNAVAASLGIRADPARLLTELAEDVRQGRAPETVSRRCLRVGDSFGFIFGNGLMANFLEQYYSSENGYGARRAMWVVLRTVGSALVSGSYAKRMFRGFSGKAWVDGELLPWPQLTALGAATVSQVGLGFKLNHRADQDPDRFGVLAIHASPLALTSDFVAVHRGEGIDPSRAWSTVASEVVIDSEGQETVYTIDGDLYQSRGRLEVGVGPMLRFVKPRSATSRGV